MMPDRTPSEDGSHLAFIVGHYKSGSSWLDNLLSAHPWVRGLSETHVFRYSATMDVQRATEQLFTTTAWSDGGLRNLPRHRLAKWLRPVRNRWKPAPAPEDRPSTLLDLRVADQLALRRLLLSSQSGEDFCRQFFRFLYGRLQPRAYLLEKTPNNILQVPYIRSIYPKAKLVAIYRDGRDVAVSDRFFRRLRQRAYTLTDSVQYWRRLMEMQLAYADQYEVYTLSYESLISDGHKILADLLQFLNLPAEPSMCDKMFHHASFEFITGRRPGEEDRGRFYRKGVSGDWKLQFTDEDKRLFKQLAGDVLIKLGYERNGDW